jgi:hypothetical protein
MTLEDVLSLPSIPYAEKRSLPDLPGLYFVVRESAEVMYVGMSRKSLRRRWLTWHAVVYSIRDAGIADVSRIAYLLCDDVESLAFAERDAIRTFSPLFNSNHVPGAYERDKRLSAERCDRGKYCWHWHADEPTPPRAGG